MPEKKPNLGFNFPGSDESDSDGKVRIVIPSDNPEKLLAQFREAREMTGSGSMVSEVNADQLDNLTSMLEEHMDFENILSTLAGGLGIVKPTEEDEEGMGFKITTPEK